jgi:hypothetical protein
MQGHIAFVGRRMQDEFGSSAATLYLSRESKYETDVVLYVIDEMRRNYYENPKTKPWIYTWSPTMSNPFSPPESETLSQPLSQPNSNKVLQEVTDKLKRRVEMLTKMKEQKEHLGKYAHVTLVIDPVTEDQQRGILYDLLCNGRHYCVSLCLVFFSVADINPRTMVQLDHVVFCLEKSNQTEDTWLEREMKSYKFFEMSKMKEPQIVFGNQSSKGVCKRLDDP